MKPRVYGLETEYALAIESADRRLRSPDPAILFNHMEQALGQRYLTVRHDSFGRAASDGQAGITIKEGCFLECGARFYYDTGHLEWATPEAANPQDAALYEVAGERTLAELARFIRVPRGSRLMLIKNNVDYVQGRTYGCHENYQIIRRGTGKADEAFFGALIDRLAPFLVTRQIYCGAGKIGSADADPEVGFQVSQRADYIAHLTSRDTRSERAIVNLRDESLADARRYRRLHLILGDSNRIAAATRLKLGATGLVLDLIEEDLLADPPVLADPVDAIKRVSRDPDCRATLALADGRRLTAIEIQRWYLERARRHAVAGADRDADALLDAWECALDDLAIDPDRLADRVDWVAKRRYLFGPQLERLGADWPQVAAWARVFAKIAADTGRGDGTAPLTAAQYARYQYLVDRLGLDWADCEDQRRLHYALRERDLRFHDIDPERGVFALLQSRGLVQAGPDDQALAHAQVHPPPGTRAQVRAQVVRWAHARQLAGRVAMDWGKVHLPDRAPIALDDPLADTSSVLQPLLHGMAERDANAPPAPAPDSGRDGLDAIRVLGVETPVPARADSRWRRLLGAWRAFRAQGPDRS